MLDPEPPELNCPHAWVGDDDCAYCRADSYYAENLSLRAEVATALCKLGSALDLIGDMTRFQAMLTGWGGAERGNIEWELLVKRGADLRFGMKK